MGFTRVKQFWLAQPIVRGKALSVTRFESTDGTVNPLYLRVDTHDYCMRFATNVTAYRDILTQDAKADADHRCPFELVGTIAPADTEETELQREQRLRRQQTVEQHQRSREASECSLCLNTILNNERVWTCTNCVDAAGNFKTRLHWHCVQLGSHGWLCSTVNGEQGTVHSHATF